MRIAVVIPVRDEAGRLGEALRSAREPEVELIVADGGSVDASVEEAQRHGARVVHAEPGRARQLDAGARASEAPVILFLHADTLLPAGWSASVRAALADDRVAGGAFGFSFSERSTALRIVEWGTRLRCRWFALPYGDQGIFVRRRVLDAIGGVPQAPIMEDVDLVAAIKLHGRLALLDATVRTSGRRYLERGALRTVLLHFAAICARGLGVERARIAAWVRR